MAEVEIGGAKITGGKLFWALPIIGALGSGAWGGFTLYQEFLDLREATENYISPDLSHIDNHMTMVEKELGIISAEFSALRQVDSATNAIITEQINSVKEISGRLQSDVHDLRMDVNQDRAELLNDLDGAIDKVVAQLDKQQELLDKQETRNRLSIEDAREYINQSRQINKETENMIRGLISSSEERRDRVVDRLDIKIAETQTMMDNMLKQNRIMIDELQTKLDDKIRKALINPLLGKK